MITAAALPYSDPAYVAMWDRITAEWRERNRFRQLRDFGRSRSSIMTADDLRRLLAYLEGAPEMQRVAIEAFKERQAERDTEMARRAHRDGRGKQAAHSFMAERRAFRKTLGKSKRQ
jgi:hypothetical protein